MHWCSFLILMVFWTKFVSSRQWIEGDVRLVGGLRRYMGTVVILHNGRWGAVCDDQWDLSDASVICRQLGYTMALRATTRSEFGHGRRKIWLSQVRCNGHEERLDECPSQYYDETTHYKCPGKYRSAGAVCSAAVPTMTSKTSPAEKEITRTEKSTAGANEAAQPLPPLTTTENMLQEWSEMKPMDAIKKKKKPIPENAISPTVNQYTETSEYATEAAQNISANTTHIFLAITATVSNLQAPTYESENSSSLLNMTEKDTYVDSSEKVGLQDSIANKVINKEDYTNDNSSSYISLQEADVALQLPCNMASQDTSSEGCEALFADEPRIENLEIRLKGGRYRWEGHLQVRINDGSWGTICSDYWTLREAMVACNQLGEYGKAKQALVTSYFGGTDVPKTVYKMQCVGRESTLASCNLTWSDTEHTCSKNTAVAGVVCSQHLPDLIPSLRAVEDSIRLQDQPLYYLRCAMEENCLASSAYVVKNTSLTWRNNMRRLLRFSTVVHNKGLADFRPYRPRGQWEWHACHMHYHSMEIFAHYDILDAKGTRLAEGSKASFCLEDTTCDSGVHPQYNCRGFADQGLSVNCSDNYMYDIDCQWIDISDIKPGEYTFLIEVNPTMLVAESNFDNNVVSCHLYYTGYFASVRNCHYESLLDYREGVMIRT